MSDNGSKPFDTSRLFAILDERVTQTLDLGEFHERFAGQTVEVWLNPTRKIVRELAKWATDHGDDDTPTFVGAMLGLNAEQTQELFSKDVAFTNWLAAKTVDMYREYAEKNGSKSKVN